MERAEGYINDSRYPTDLDCDRHFVRGVLIRAIESLDPDRSCRSGRRPPHSPEEHAVIRALEQLLEYTEAV